MSRSQQKSREQGKKPPLANTPAVVSHEIIPGKFSEHDWVVLLEHDDADEFVTDIVETVCANSFDIIYKSYIQKQLIPYTVSQAKDALVQIIEFLEREPQIDNTGCEPAWQQDEEPVPAVVDCWAQGSVPHTVYTVDVIKPALIEEPEESLVPIVESRPAFNDDINSASIFALEAQMYVSSPTMADNEETGQVTISEAVTNSNTILPENATGKPKTSVQFSSTNSRKARVKRQTGPLPPANVDKMTESLDKADVRQNAAGGNGEAKQVAAIAAVETGQKNVQQSQMPASCQSLLKLQAGRPPGNREVVYDEHGNIVSVTKVDVDKLSTFTVRTIFRVIDPETEAAQARLEAMRTGKYKKKSAQAKAVQITAANRTTAKRGASKTDLHPVPSTRERLVTLPPPLIESMNVAEGVVVREGERVKEGPKKERTSKDKMIGMLPLQPVRLRPDDPLLHIAELLDRAAAVRPLVDTSPRPLPPIRQQPLRS